MICLGKGTAVVVVFVVVDVVVVVVIELFFKSTSGTVIAAIMQARATRKLFKSEKKTDLTDASNCDTDCPPSSCFHLDIVLRHLLSNCLL